MRIRNTIEADVQKAVKNLRKISRTIVPESEISALNKAQRRISTVGVKGTAGDAKVSQKVIRARLRTYRANKKKQYASTYIFRRDVSASGLNPKQNRRGVKAGKHSFQGAFLADGSKGVGKYRNKKFQATRLTRQQVLQRQGKGRYPLDVVKVPIASAATQNFQKAARLVMTSEYSGLFRHELNRRIKRAGINA